MNKHLSLMLKIIEYGIFGFLFAVFFVIISPRLPTEKFVKTYIVPTGSMYPAVHPGSVAVVNPQVLDLVAGNIIAFKNPVNRIETILHRVVSVEEAGIRTKGDNNNAPDTWVVSPNDVEGQLVLAIPFLGYIAAFVKTRLGFFLLAFIPSVFLGATFLWDILQGIEEEMGKRRTRAKLVVIWLLFFGGGFYLSRSAVPQAFAAYSAVSSVSGISFSGIAAPLPSASPSPIPSSSPSPTPTLSPSPTGSHFCHDIAIDISGNGAGSTNSVEITCLAHHIILQINKLHLIHAIHYQSEYDSDEGHHGIVGTIEIDGETVIRRELFLGDCSDIACVIHKNTKNKKLKVEIE